MTLLYCTWAPTSPKGSIGLMDFVCVGEVRPQFLMNYIHTFANAPNHLMIVFTVRFTYNEDNNVIMTVNESASQRRGSEYFS